MKVLITCAGSPVIASLIKELKKLGHNLVVCDAKEPFLGQKLADSFSTVPYAFENNYIKKLHQLYKKEKIDVILEGTDIGVLKIIRNKQLFKRNKMIYPYLKTIEVCVDKEKLYRFLAKEGFLHPKVCKLNSISDSDFPLFIKPAISSGSKNAFKLDNLEETKFFVKKIKKPVIQKFIEGIEYTIDCLVDRKGKIIYLVPRKRLSTQGGFSSVAKISRNKKIIDQAEKIIKKMELRGPCFLQCILDKMNRVYFTEVTPRLSGSVYFLKGAGINSVDLLFKIMVGLDVSRQSFREIVGFRYFKELF